MNAVFHQGVLDHTVLQAQNQSTNRYTTFLFTKLAPAGEVCDV